MLGLEVSVRDVGFGASGLGVRTGATRVEAFVKSSDPMCSKLRQGPR